MKRFNLFTISILVLLLFICTCRKYDNVYDKNATVAPEKWTPTAFTHTITNNNVVLTWSKAPITPEGYKIDKATNDAWQNNYAVVSPYHTTFTDTAVNPFGNSYLYRICAFAGGQVSNSQSVTVYKYSIPTVTTTAISEITNTTAISGGNVKSDGGLSITVRGVCWSANQNPTTADGHTNDGTGSATFVSNITGLTLGSTYYLRAYATNSLGTAYGNEISFLTTSPPTDFDGNVYTTVIIGTQEWMVENLKTTHYRNGDPIPNVTDNSQWGNLRSGAYCWYGNQISNKEPYGALYNWYTVNDSRNICPVGWHVPTDAEWTTLTSYLGGGSVAGGKMKEAGTTHWSSPNTGATNSSGFTALPGGYRYGSGAFDNVTYGGGWWSSTAHDASYAWLRYLYYSYANASRGSDSMRYGFSVRCVRDY